MPEKHNYTSVFSSRAQRELIVSFDWYEEQQTGLGDSFIENVLAKVKLIEQYPMLYSVKSNIYREATIVKFPFVIVYSVNNRKRRITIVSVFHTSRLFNTL